MKPKLLAVLIATITVLCLSFAASADDGVPAQMQPGSTVQISMSLKNTGANNWSSAGDSPVRFVLRWIDVQNHTRYRWAVKWLNGTVKPGDSTTLSFDLTAPTRAGKYQLMCGLVRLTPKSYDGSNYHPPASNAPDQHWDGEFSTVTYDVNVSP
jgi:hypothetical protein